ncbi:MULTISPECIES: four-helix bundle copper-binding protein [Comamonas]
MAKHFCKLCGEICLACANECEQHLREHTRRCAIDCHACAKECHALIN